jgi:membrane fusion protein (multidrug efflux system)
LRHIRVGQPVTLTADLYGGKVTYHGKVEGFSAGTGSAFALLPAQNATGNWIKVVQRVPVRIALDAKELQEHPLRVGLSMDVEVDVHNQGGENLAVPNASTKINSALTAAPAFVSAIDAKAKSRIDAIIAANLK